MRICIVGNGASIHTVRWVRYLREAGHSVLLVSLQPVLAEAHRLGIDLLENRRIPANPIARSLCYALFLPRVLRAIGRFEPDVLHVHEAFAHGLIALLCRRVYMLTPWGTDVLIMPDRSCVFRWYVSKVVLRARYVLHDGGPHMDRRLTELGAREENVSTFSFGVDVTRFRPEARGPVIRNRFGIPLKSPVVIQTRRLEPVYDVTTFVRAAAIVARQEPETHFIIGGQGTERQALETLCRQLGIEERTRFIGWLGEGEMAECLASCEVYVSSSSSDAGLAASTAEAMASGLPAVITAFGDNGRWIRDGEGGFLFPVGDHEALAACVVRLLRDPGLRHRCGEVNRARICAENNYITQMADVERLYERVFGVELGPGAAQSGLDIMNKGHA